MANLDDIAANKYLISAGHYLAARAGFDILQAGGNAIDAGVASNLALGVLQSDQVNFAGVAPIMIYLADRKQTLTIAGLGGWPKAARLDHFIESCGGEVPLGLLRTVVPAAPDAHIMALEQFGTMSFGEVAAAAIGYAAQGFPMHGLMSDYIAAHEDRYRRWPENAAIYLPGDRAPRPGERFVQTDLASTIQHMVDEERAAVSRGKGRAAGLEAARDAFYRGDIAQTILAYHRENGGLLSADDLAGYRSPVEPAMARAFPSIAPGFEVMTCGPWCQGPVLLQMLGLVEAFDLRSLGHNSIEYLHVLAECIKLSFADREQYFGDPDFVDVPLDQLLDEPYLAGRRGQVDMQRAFDGLPAPGLTPGKIIGASEADPRAEVALPGDTSFTCVVDEAGNVFSSNPSDVTWESPVIPGTGICPSSRGSQSWAVAGHASSVGPGKRPRLTPNPVMFRRAGGAPLPIGTPGGDVQPQALLQVLLNLVCFGMRPQEAVDQPRIVTHSQPDSFAPHTAYPGRLDIESTAGQAVAEGLASLGHKVETLRGPSYRVAGVCLIDRDEEAGAWWGAADRRRPSQAIGW